MEIIRVHPVTIDLAVEHFNLKAEVRARGCALKLVVTRIMNHRRVKIGGPFGSITLAPASYSTVYQPRGSTRFDLCLRVHRLLLTSPANITGSLRNNVLLIRRKQCR